MKIKLLLLSLIFLISYNADAQTTRVQFINNCPDVSISGIDIYVDGTLFFNDLNFRTATPFIDITAGSTINIGIADLASISVTDTFVNKNINLNANNRYIIVINGVKSTTGYTPNKKVNLDVFNQAKEGASFNRTEVMFANGCTDGNSIDLRTGISTLADNIDYGEFGAAYTELLSANSYNFRLTNEKGNITTHNFDGDFPNLPVSGKAVVLLTSGFLNPSNNSNGASFGLWMATSDGGPLYELLPTTREALARVQLIHNSADTGVGEVDIFFDNEKYIDTLNFRNATAYFDAYAKPTVNIGFAKPGSSTQFFNMNITLDSGKTYAAVINGIYSDTNYKPIPALTISLYNGAKEDAGLANNVDVLMMHGSTDAPPLRVNDFFNAPVTMNLSYGGFSTGYSPMFVNPVTLLRVDTGTIFKHLAKYEIKTNDWNLLGRTTTILASGFANPDSNSGGPKFGFWAALPQGGALRELPVYVSVNEVTKKADAITVWPNPATSTLHFASNNEKSNLIVTDITGKVLLKENNTTDKFISISNLDNGNYLLFVQNETGEVAYSKFTKL